MFSFDDLKKFSAGDRITVRHELSTTTKTYRATVVRRNSVSLTVDWRFEDGATSRGKVLAGNDRVTVERAPFCSQSHGAPDVVGRGCDGCRASENAGDTSCTCCCHEGR